MNQWEKVCLHNLSGLVASQHGAKSNDRLFCAFSQLPWLQKMSLPTSADCCLKRWVSARSCVIAPRRNKRVGEPWACVCVFPLNVCLSLTKSFSLCILPCSVSPPLLSLQLSNPPSCFRFVYPTKQISSFAWAWGCHFLPGLISMATEGRQNIRMRGEKTSLERKSQSRGVSRNQEPRKLMAVFWRNVGPLRQDWLKQTERWLLIYYRLIKLEVEQRGRANCYWFHKTDHKTHPCIPDNRDAQSETRLSARIWIQWGGKTKNIPLTTLTIHWGWLSNFGY